jgi:hypothetical protein
MGQCVMRHIGSWRRRGGATLSLPQCRAAAPLRRADDDSRSAPGHSRTTELAQLSIKKRFGGFNWARPQIPYSRYLLGLLRESRRPLGSPLRFQLRLISEIASSALYDCPDAVDHPRDQAANDEHSNSGEAPALGFWIWRSAAQKMAENGSQEDKLPRSFGAPRHVCRRGYRGAHRGSGRRVAGI